MDFYTFETEELPRHVANHYDDGFNNQDIQYPDGISNQNYGISAVFSNKDEQVLEQKLINVNSSKELYLKDKRERAKAASKRYREKRLTEIMRKDEILQDRKTENFKLKELLDLVNHTKHRMEELTSTDTDIYYYDAEILELLMQENCTFINKPLQFEDLKYLSILEMLMDTASNTQNKIENNMKHAFNV